MSEKISIAIFAKAPIPGFAKTRLIPALGAEAAARLQDQLIARAVTVAQAANLGPVSLWCTPDVGHECFARMAKATGVELHQQGEGDLGERMSAAFSVLLRAGPALLMGADCALMTTELLRNCAVHLCHDADAVLNRPSPGMFADIPWHGGDVMSATRARGAHYGLRLAEPAMLWDIDRPEDYARALHEGILLPNDQ
jgi:rSAM/selenodomain-associated transferase 1